MAKKNPAVAEVTEGIGVDKDATPDQAMLDEAAKSGAAAQAAAVDATTPEIDPEAQAPVVTEVVSAEGDAVPEAEHLGTPAPDGTEYLPAGERERLPAGAGVESKLHPIPSAPTARETKKAAKEAAAAARAARKTQSPSLKRLGPLGEKLPGAEHIIIYKRDDKGKKHAIETYDANDLSDSQGVAEFIITHLKKKYGDGDYPIVGVNAHGVEFDAGTIRVLNPEPEPELKQEMSPLVVLNQWLAKDAERREREVADLRSAIGRQPQVKDPIDTVEKVMGLQEKFGGPAKKENEGTMAALITSMSSQNQTMMKMMLEQQTRSSEQLLTILTSLRSNGPDPIMATLVAGLLEDRKSGKGDPLPPMPTPKDPVEELKTLAEVMVLLRPPESKGDGEFTKYLLMKAEKDAISPKEMIELIRGERGTDDFKRSFDNLGLMLTAMKTLKDHTGEGGGAGAGFWEALTQLAGNRDFAGAVSNAIRAKTAGAAGAAGPALPGQQHQILTAGAQEQQVVGQLQQRLEAVRARRVAIAEELAAEEEALDQDIAQMPNAHAPRVVPQPAETPPQAPAPAAAPVPAAVHVPPAAAAHAGVPVATPEQEAAVQRVAKRTGGRMPQLPSGIADHINALLEAPEEADLVERTIRMLFYLGDLEDWKVFSDTVMGLIREGDKENAFAFLSEFFNGLQDIGLVSPNLVVSVIQAFDTHFEMIVGMAQEAAANENAEAEEEEEFEDGEPEELPDEVDSEPEEPEPEQ